MHSDLQARFDALSDAMIVPKCPLPAIRAEAMNGRASTRRHYRPAIAAVFAAFCCVAIAAAAGFVRSHVDFARGGGMVISSNTGSSRTISSDDDVRAAAAKLDFQAVLPSGLPAGSKPVRLYTSGTDLMAVTYDLPGAWRASHHLAWIFLANPATLHGLPAPAPNQLETGRKMSMKAWRAGAEEVILVSNGLTAKEAQRIEDSMH